MQRGPKPHDSDCAIEIGQAYEAADFGAAATPALGQREERLRAARWGWYSCRLRD